MDTGRLGGAPSASRAPDRAEVLVVGGGPAGAATAIACAQAGLRVVLVERRRDGLVRPGETLHPGVEPLLERLGVLRAVVDAGALRHAGHWVRWAGDAAPRFEAFGHDAHGPWLGFQVSRTDFEALLLDRARALGVEVLCPRSAQRPVVQDGRVVGAVVDGAVIGARFTVDAAGGRHWLSRALGLPVRRHSRTLIARYGHATGRCPRLDGAPALMALGAGWLWTARVRIGLYAWVRLDLDAGAPLDASWRPEEFSGLEPLGSARGADVTWRRAEVFSGPGYVLAGDAAATVDPLSSHGVLRALTSGMAAAHLMAGALRRGEPEGLGGMAYGRWLDAWFRRDIHSLSRHLGALQMAALPPSSGVGPDWIRSALPYNKGAQQTPAPRRVLNASASTRR